MKLTDLEPRFLRQYEQQDTWTEITRDPTPGESLENVPTRQLTGMKEYGQVVQSVGEANAIFFLCPKCFAANGGPRGTHGVEVTFAGRSVPDHLGSHSKDGKPTRWEVSGSTFTDLTLRPSILLDDDGGCAWHGFVTNGDVT